MIFPVDIELSNRMPSPAWVESGAKEAQGLDLLGLRLSVQVIGNDLLDGVTTITPSVRYLSILCWTIYVYGKAKKADTWKDFRAFAARVEAAVALGNILVDDSVVGVIGSTEARSLVESGGEALPLREFVARLATDIYVNPSKQLGLIFSRDPSFPGLTRERGLVLANVVEGELQKTRLGFELSQGFAPDSTDREDLNEFGKAVFFNRIPDSETAALIEAILPCEPLPSERHRFQTYTCLLALADQLSAVPKETDLFVEAEAAESHLPPELEPILDGWLRYRVRDLIAYVHEVAFREIVCALSEHSGGVSGSVESEAVIRRLIGHLDDQKEALRDLQLVRADEDINALSLRVLNERCLDAVGSVVNRRGLNRGTGILRESMIIDIAGSAGAGAPVLLPVSWSLAVWRTEPWKKFSPEPFEFAAAGWNHMGLAEVIQPLFQEFLDKDRSVRDVTAELAYRTVNQHLDITWSRMAADPTRDVAVFLSDADNWHDRGKDFQAGRTASRLKEATNWLVQLGLLDRESGLTAEGQLVLDRCIRTIRDWGA